MVRVLTNVTVCIDCALIIANDDDSGVIDPVGHRAQMSERMMRGTWVIGTTGDPISAEPCDACGTTLHGERMHGHVLTNVTAPEEGPTYDRHGKVDPFAADPDRITRREAFL